MSAQNPINTHTTKINCNYPKEYYNHWPTQSGKEHLQTERAGHRLNLKHFITQVLFWEGYQQITCMPYRKLSSRQTCIYLTNT